MRFRTSGLRLRASMAFAPTWYDWRKVTRVMTTLDAMPYGLMVAMTTGLFGATFFMLIQLQQRISEGGLTDARDMWTWPMLLLRCIVGVGAAAILYFFFNSGLLEGSLWPRLEYLSFQVVRLADDVSKADPAIARTTEGMFVPNREWALLIVWSFIAGYSQTLVPNLLLNTEGRQAKQ